MGTRFELAIVTDAPPDVRRARASARAEDGPATVDLHAVGELALREIEDWHRRLTRFEPDSWLSHVNRSAAHESIRLDDEVFPLFADAMQVWRDSSGAFDIARGDGDALALDLDARTLRFRREGVSLDMGAIGKGHALDCAALSLRSHGLTRALLQGGTSSAVAMGRPADANAWRIGVSSRAGAVKVDDVLDLVDQSFSLSDEASQPDAPIGRHIVDPRVEDDAAPAHAARRVIVTGPSARLADAWSTALAVLGDVPPAFPVGYTARFLRE
jgi:thiamine biosynthesis lipoprotein